MPLHLTSGFESVQGRRWTMEDTHVLIDDLNANIPIPNNDHPRAYYAVFDGHGGKDAADLAAEHLHKDVVGVPSFLSGNIKDALTEGFSKTDKLILDTGAKQKWTNGATAVVVFIVGHTLYLGNAGDSEAVLAQIGEHNAHEAHLLSEKHKPSDERERIEAAGGHVIFGRVLGNLAVSRSLGDSDFKVPMNRASADWVSAVPYTHQIELSPKNPFLIIACDGLWDKMTYQEAVEFIFQRKEEGKSPVEAAQLITQEALNKGSLDNITTVIVYLNWVE